MNVAVKLMRSESTRDPTAVRDFEREIDILRTSRHPRVLKIFAACVQPSRGVVALVAELVDGGSLHDALRGEGVNGHVDARARLGVLRDVCEGMDYLHRARTPKVVHRDLKPQNILLSSGPPGKPRATIADFGVARASPHTNLRATCNAVGTLAYMAPELFNGGGGSDYGSGGGGGGG